MSYHLFNHLSVKSELKTDRVIAVAPVVYPLIGVPQVIELFWRHSAGGVSLISWLVVDLLVVTGVIMYG